MYLRKTPHKKRTGFRWHYCSAVGCRVHPGRVTVFREGRQALQAAIRLPNLRHGQGRLYLQWGAVSGGFTVQGLTLVT